MSFETLIAERFFALYGHPQTDNPALYFAEWKRAFDRTDPEVLTAAVDQVIDSRKILAWPSIGELKAAVNDVREDIAAERARRTLRIAGPKEKEPTKAERARVAKLMVEIRRALNGNTFNMLKTLRAS